MAVNKKKVGLGVGLGLAAAAASAAGYYFYAHKDAAKNRKKAAKWANDMKSEVVKQAKNAKKLSKSEIHSIVNQSMKTYKNLKSVDTAELAAAGAELKANWDRIVEEVNKARKPAKKASAKKPAKKAVAKKK